MSLIPKFASQLTATCGLVGLLICFQSLSLQAQTTGSTDSGTDSGFSTNFSDSMVRQNAAWFDSNDQGALNRGIILRSTPPLSSPPTRRNDWRSIDNGNGNFFSAEPVSNPVLIPEPMLFDLVRPLGARKGELEINTLAVFPWRAINRDLSRDPFGSGQTTRDREGIEWAPEIEYAFADGWAIEFELPFESSTLEAYKLALQGTFGTAFDNHYIHGFQWIVEPTTDWKRWNSTLLYLAGIRFDEKWSALLMFGGRMDLAGRNNAFTFERLINATLFHEVNSYLTLGTEVNHAVGILGRYQTIVVPQLHYQLTRCIELQSGVGLGVFDEGSEQSFIMRAIWQRE